MKIIETERLYLRELRMDDKPELMKVLSDPESMQYYPHPFCEQEVERWIQWNLENYHQYQHGLWAVILKEGQVFLGDCGITMQISGMRSFRKSAFISSENTATRVMRPKQHWLVSSMPLKS